MEKVGAYHQPCSSFPSFTVNHRYIFVVFGQPFVDILAERPHLFHNKWKVNTLNKINSKKVSLVFLTDSSIILPILDTTVFLEIREGLLGILVQHATLFTTLLYHLSKFWWVVIVKGVDGDPAVKLRDVIRPLTTEIVDLVVISVLGLK